MRFGMTKRKRLCRIDLGILAHTSVTHYNAETNFRETCCAIVTVPIHT